MEASLKASRPAAQAGLSALAAKSVSKSFYGNTVLRDFSIGIKPGESRALLGHNGSGKSTFVKILSGYHTPEPHAGEITVAGEALHFGDPDHARSLGLRFVHQDLGLVPDLTVLENLRLGTDYNTGYMGHINWREERARAMQELALLGMRIDPEARCSQLQPAERTQVAIARALRGVDDVRLLVLDEATASLPAAEVRKLFGILKQIVNLGIGILYVTHRLDEVAEITDTVTVLRNGAVVGEGPSKDLSTDDLVKLIVGDGNEGAQISVRDAYRSLHPDDRDVQVDHPATSDREVAEFRDVTAGQLQGFSFQMRAHEIVGLAGIVGSGVEDVARVLAGELEVAEGETRVMQQSVRIATPRKARQMGVTVLMAARDQKLVGECSVRENITLPIVRRFWRGGRMATRYEKAYTQGICDDFSIRCRGVDSKVKSLSGGNQQKVAVAKALQCDPHLLVMCEPTQGVDARGRRDIAAVLRQAAQDGVAVLVCSSDLEDLTTMCDRTLIVREGRVVQELEGENMTDENIVRACYGE